MPQAGCQVSLKRLTTRFTEVYNRTSPQPTASARVFSNRSRKGHLPLMTLSKEKNPNYANYWWTEVFRKKSRKCGLTPSVASPLPLVLLLIAGKIVLDLLIHIHTHRDKDV